eukprot:1152789-Pelagomonas_calceolata.AAC.7
MQTMFVPQVRKAAPQMGALMQALFLFCFMANCLPVDSSVTWFEKPEVLNRDWQEIGKGMGHTCHAVLPRNCIPKAMYIPKKNENPSLAGRLRATRKGPKPPP